MLSRSNPPWDEMSFTASSCNKMWIKSRQNHPSQGQTLTFAWKSHEKIPWIPEKYSNKCPNNTIFVTAVVQAAWYWIRDSAGAAALARSYVRPGFKNIRGHLPFTMAAMAMTVAIHHDPRKKAGTLKSWIHLSRHRQTRPAFQWALHRAASFVT